MYFGLSSLALASGPAGTYKTCAVFNTVEESNTYQNKVMTQAERDSAQLSPLQPLTNCPNGASCNSFSWVLTYETTWANAAKRGCGEVPKY